MPLQTTVSLPDLRDRMRASDRPRKADRFDLGAAGAQPALSIIMPVYNERESVLGAIRRVLAVRFPVKVEVIVVDDGSTDGSSLILRSMTPTPGVRVVFQEANTGKGGAVRNGLRHARGKYVVIQDADDELDASDLPALLDAVRRGRAEVCYGSRFLEDNGRFRWRPNYWANRFLNGVCNRLNGIRLTDMNTCYKLMPTQLARRLDITSRGFSLEPEITTKLARLGVKVIELPVAYRPRSRAMGKKIELRDFFRYLSAMVRFRFQRMDLTAVKRPDLETANSAARSAVVG